MKDHFFASTRMLSFDPELTFGIAHTQALRVVLYGGCSAAELEKARVWMDCKSLRYPLVMSGVLLRHDYHIICDVDRRGAAHSAADIADVLAKVVQEQSMVRRRICDATLWNVQNPDVGALILQFDTEKQAKAACHSSFGLLEQLQREGIDPSIIQVSWYGLEGYVSLESLKNDDVLMRAPHAKYAADLRIRLWLRSWRCSRSDRPSRFSRK